MDVTTSGSSGRSKIEVAGLIIGSVIGVLGVVVALVVGLMAYFAAAEANQLAQQGLDRTKEADSMKLAEPVWINAYRERPPKPPVVTVTVVNGGAHQDQPP